jgi:hypothetical protein
MELVTLAFADYDHPDAESSPNKDAPPHAKRRKINLACEQCRARKARCDGSKPVCGNCTRRNEQCVYKVTKAQMDTTQDYVDSLLSKIAALEDENARLREQKENNERDIVTRMMHGSGLPMNSGGSPQQASHAMSAGRLIVNKKSSDVDAMGAASSFGHPRLSKDSYFGYSSTSTLMEQVLKAIGDGNDSSEAVSSTSSLPIGIDNALFEADFAGPENFSLFPRPVTDFLLNRYWDKVYTLYPFIHKPTFMQSYERLWHANARIAPDNSALGLGESRSAGPLSFVFHCGLNAMLILGLQFTDLPAAEKDSLTFQCLQKCKNLLKVDLFNEGSLAVLQTTLLLAHYFQSTTSPNKCWNIVGISCRIAQSLGLHVDGIRPTKFPPIERELRRRVWYSCVMLDMIIAMALGRPVMLRRRHAVPLPEPTDDEYLLHNIPQPENHLSDLMFFKETIKLYKVMRDSLAELYKDGPCSGSDSRKLDKTVELDSELVNLQGQLPDALHWDKSAPPNLRVNRAVLEQQRHVLHLRFLVARMSLHRPLFIEYCRMKQHTKSSHYPGPSTDLAEHFTKCAAIVCIQASINVTEALEQYADTEATCEWWLSLFFIRMTAVILMITKTQPKLVEEISESRLNLAWQSCKNVLKNKMPANELVRNCLESLESMYEQVERYINARVVANAEPAATSTNAKATDSGDNGMGFDIMDGGVFNLGMDEWGFGIDDYGAPLI